MNGKILLPILIMVVSVFAVKAQEPINVKVCYEGRGHTRITKELASEIFIQEKAKVAMCNWEQSTVFTLRVEEESVPLIGYEEIRVAFVNNASIVSPYFFKGDCDTLEIYPLRNGVFYCKDYTPKELSKINSKERHDNIERDIEKFLEHPAAGDTLRHWPKFVDSRYTQQLIDNLSNDNEIYLELTIHSDGVQIVRFLGIKIKEKSVGWTDIEYEPVRMSEFARYRLNNIFDSSYWTFNFPDIDASAEEWQSWLDELIIKE